MKLEDVFERVVVINLAFKADRRSRLKSDLLKLGISDPGKIHWQRAVCGDWTPPPAWWGAGNGAWGCLMSHLRVAQDAVHDNLASYCVLEDDVVFHSEAPSMLDAFMKEIPSDWGQIYLGGQFLHKEPEILSPWVVSPYNVNRTHAFALSASTIPLFLQHIMNAPDYFSLNVADNGERKYDHNCFHIDHQLGRAHERQDWKTYAPTWWMAGQEAGSSNISGRITPRMWWHWRDRGLSLPFFFLNQGADTSLRNMAAQYLHVGYNPVGNSLTDIGLSNELDDGALLNWLTMISREAIELWKLPGFEVPEKFPDLPDRVAKIWPPGLFEAEEKALREKINYPFNGLCQPQLNPSRRRER